MKSKLINLARKAEHTVYTYISQVVVILSGFVLMWQVNKYLGVAEYGKYAIILASAGMALKLTAARTGEAIIKFYIDERENCRFDNALLSIYLGVLVDLVSAFFSCVLILALGGVISEFMSPNDPIKSELQIFTLFIFFSFLKSTPLGYFQARSQFSYINVLNMVEAMLKILLLALLLTQSKDGVVLVVWSAVIASGVVCIAVLWRFFFELYRDFGSFRFSFDIPFVKVFARFAAKTFSSATLKAVNQSSDVLILGALTSPSVVGLYEVLKKVGSAISFVAIPFPFIAFPKFSKMYSEGHPKAIVKMVRTQTAVVAAGAISLFLSIQLLAPTVFGLLSISDPDVRWMFAWVGVGLVANVCVWWGRIYSNVVDPSISLKINMFVTVYMLSVAIVGTRLYGLDGMLISVCVMHLSVLMLYIYSIVCFSRREVK